MIWCWGSGGGNLGTFDIKNIYFNLTNSGASVLWFGNHTSNYLPITDNGVGGNFKQKQFKVSILKAVILDLEQQYALNPFQVFMVQRQLSASNMLYAWHTALTA